MLKLLYSFLSSIFKIKQNKIRELDKILLVGEPRICFIPQFMQTDKFNCLEFVIISNGLENNSTFFYYEWLW